MTPKLIVKVQLSLGAETPRRVLIYNKIKSLYYEAVADDEIKRRVNHRPKSYWFAELRDGGKLHITKEAGAQRW